MKRLARILEEVKSNEKLSSTANDGKYQELLLSEMPASLLTTMATALKNRAASLDAEPKQKFETAIGMIQKAAEFCYKNNVHMIEGGK